MAIAYGMLSSRPEQHTMMAKRQQLVRGQKRKGQRKQLLHWESNGDGTNDRDGDGNGNGKGKWNIDSDGNGNSYKDGKVDGDCEGDSN